MNPPISPMEDPAPLLFSNSFPFALVRRPLSVRPRSLGDLLAALAERPYRSAWGHANTLPAAKALVGRDLTPANERPALTLSRDGFPVLDGETFDECWLLSPDYTPGFRPQVGEEVPPEKILGWQVLQLEWEQSPTAEAGA